MTPQEVLDAIVRALQDSSHFDGGSYATHDLDLDGADNRLQQPAVSLQPTSTIRADQWNTDRVGYTTDDAGNRTGQIFDATFEMDVQLDVWVAAGNAQLDATELGGDLQQALLQHDAQAAAAPLPDGNGGTVDDVEELLVGDGRRQDDLAGPGIRRWRQALTVEFVERVTTDEAYVEVVNVPTSGTASGDDTVAIELYPETQNA